MSSTNSNWVKKTKGNAKIYINPVIDFAIVENHYGISWNGKWFASVEEAKKVIEQSMSSLSFSEQLRQTQQEARKKIETEKEQNRLKLNAENEALKSKFEADQIVWVENNLPKIKEKMLDAANKGFNSVRLSLGFGDDDIPFVPNLLRKNDLVSRPEPFESWRVIDTFKMVEKALGDGITVEYKSYSYDSNDPDMGYHTFSEEYMDIIWK